NAASPQDSGIAEIVKRELSDIRFSQTERDRHTQDSLEAVHSTLGHVVDRLAMIEGDLRAVRSAPVAPVAAQPEAPPPLPPVAAPPRESHAAEPAMPAAVAVPKAISEILEPQAAAPRPAIEPELPPDH